MSCAICSTRASIASAALKKNAARAGAGRAAQAGNASRAAATAALASSAVDAANTPVTSDGRQGLCFSYVSPDALSLHSPPMKLRAAVVVRVSVIVRSFAGRSVARTTGFVSVPISGTWISTTCPGRSVNSSGGTSPVPVSSTLPGGTGLSRTSQLDEVGEASASSARSRSRPRTTRLPARRGSCSSIESGASQSSGTYTAGPRAHAAANTFACGR